MKSFSLMHLPCLAGVPIGPNFPGMHAHGHGARRFQKSRSVKTTCRRISFIAFIALLLVQPFLAGQVSAQEQTIDAKSIERLEQLIKAQQQQLEYLQQQLNELKETAASAQTGPKDDRSVAAEAGKAAEPPAEKVATPDNWEKWAPVADVEPPDPKVVTSSQERVKLSIYGMVNRAVNVVDDGKDTDAYIVDNDNAESRVGF